MNKNRKAAPKGPSIPSQLDTSPLSFLVAPKDAKEFLSTNWEQQPVVLKATPERKAFLSGLFSVKALLDLAKQRDKDEESGPLLFELDVNAARYVKGQRETPNGEVADLKTLKELWAAGTTLQLHQPQRWVDPLWRLMAALESQLGCLVGCNAYLTPAGMQGLAPHHDDVEVFVCQTEGSKRWRLYRPVAGFELPAHPSGDLPEEALGEPILEVTLEEGDVLYMPRGTVHQAMAQGGPSTHLTLSTYQHWSWGDLMQSLVKVAASQQCEPLALPLQLRKGLPFGHLFTCGLQAELLHGPHGSPAEVKSAAAALAAGLRALAEKIEAQPQEMVTAATDSLALDFLKSRLPPHPAQLPDQGPPPTLDDAIFCTAKRLFMVVPVQGPEDSEVPEGFVKLVTCLQNDRMTHMMPPSCEDGDSSDDGSDEGDESSDGDTDAEEHDHSHAHKHKKAMPSCCISGACGPSKSRKRAADHACDEGSGKTAKLAHSHDEKQQTSTHHHHHSSCCATGSCGSKPSKAHGAAAHEHSDTHAHSHDHKHGHACKHDHEHEHEEDDCSENEDDSEECVEMEDDELPGPVFPACYAVTIAKVLAATADMPMKVKDLAVPDNDDDEKLRLAYTLWSCNVVCTVGRSC